MTTRTIKVFQCDRCGEGHDLDSGSGPLAVHQTCEVCGLDVCNSCCGVYFGEGTRICRECHGLQAVQDAITLRHRRWEEAGREWRETIQRIAAGAAREAVRG